MNKNMAKYKLFNSKLTTVISISMVLFLLGIVAMVLKIGDKMSDYVKENYTLTATIRDNSDQKEIDATRQILEGKPFVKRVKYISKEEALEDLTAELGEDPVDFIGYNPLQATFEVKLHSDYTERDSISRAAAQIKSYTCIADVDYHQQFIGEVNQNIQKITVLVLGVAAVLLFISFVLINNTVRLLVYADRFLINTMKLVGATRSFIRKPYLRQGVVIGILAAILASIYTIVLFVALKDKFTLLVDFSDSGLYCAIFGTIFVSGIIITLISTYLAVGKFLSKSEGELYYI